MAENEAESKCFCFILSLRNDEEKTYTKNLLSPEMCFSV